jgi:predicted DNA-binding transcriptional regulator AlpA
MRKETLKQIRNNVIRMIWDEKKNEIEMKDIAYMFGVSLPQIYRIIKGRNKSKKKKIKWKLH